MSRRALLALVPALMASACMTMEPRYQRPAAPVPSSFPAGAAYPAASEGATPASEIAWKDFILDARLQQVIDQGLANNRDLRIAAANIASARAQYRIQRADLFPTIEASVSGTASKGATTSGSTTGSSDETRSYRATAGLSSYEIDLFGRVRSLSKAAQESYFATGEAARATRISLIGETASAWLTLAADRSQLQLAQSTRDNAKRSMDLTQSRKDAGVASRLDVRSAETIFRQASADVASYTTLVAQDRNALDLLVGASVDEALLPQSLDEKGSYLADVQAGVSSTVLLNRPDVLEAEHRLRSANANIGAARAAFFPTVSLTGSGGLASSALSSLFDGGTSFWSIAPQIALTIFDGGAKKASLDYSKAQRDLYVATYEQAVQTAFRETADALARRGTIGDQLAAQTGLRDAAADTYVLSKARYEAGIDGYLSYLDSQRSLYSAQQGLITTRLTGYDNLVTLYRVLGGGVK